MKLYIKQHIQRYGLLLLLLVSVSISAQEDPASQLVGTWLLDDQASFSSMDSETQARMDSIPQLHNQLLSSYKGRKAFFGSDGTYTVTLSDGRSVSGSWQLISTEELQFTDPGGNTTYQRIGGLNATHMVLIPIDTGDFKSVIRQWHYVKL